MIVAVSIARGSTLATSTSARTRPVDREVVAQGLGLPAPERGEAPAAGRTGDGPVEPGVGIAVADQDQPHAPPPLGRDATFIPPPSPSSPAPKPARRHRPSTVSGLQR